jgi:hypothetical protein
MILLKMLLGSSAPRERRADTRAASALRRVSAGFARCVREATHKSATPWRRVCAAAARERATGSGCVRSAASARGDACKQPEERAGGPATRRERRAAASRRRATAWTRERTWEWVSARHTRSAVLRALLQLSPLRPAVSARGARATRRAPRSRTPPAAQGPARAAAARCSRVVNRRWSCLTGLRRS